MISAAIEAVLVQVHAYVASSEGQHRIQQALQRRRLPGAFDTEIEEAVLGEALRFLSNGGEITSVAGWCNARIAARSIDLARGTIRREAREALDPLNAAPAARVEADWGADAGDVPHDDLASLRQAVLESDTDALDICGALTFIAVVADEAVLAPDCPQPVAGARPEDAACWAGLWYAQRLECFGDGNTVTQRRSRAAKRIKAVLAAAAGSANGRHR